MKTKTIILFLIIHGSSILIGKTILSNNAKLSLLVTSASLSPNAAFGHTSIRVQDQDLDLTFGLLAPVQPDINLYTNLLVGKAYYQWSIDHFSDIKEKALKQENYIHEYHLNLSSAQKQALFDSLYHTYRYKHYTLYRYHLRNCTTHIKDILCKVEGISFSPIEHEPPTSARAVLQNDLQNNFLLKLLLADIGVGSYADISLANHQQAFSPLSFQKQLAYLNNKGQKLITSSYVHYPQFQNQSAFTSSDGWSLVLLVLMATVLYFAFANAKRFYFFQRLMLLMTGILGILLCLLFYKTKEPLLMKNYNILWCLPTNMIAALFKKLWLKFYLTAYSLWLILFVFISLFLPQSFPIALYIGLLFQILLNHNSLHFLYHEKNNYSL